MSCSLVQTGRHAAVALLLALLGCDLEAQRECHRRVVERSGCCPACDAECRSAVSRECAEQHDTPLALVEGEAELGTSSSSSGGSDDEPRPQ